MNIEPLTLLFDLFLIGSGAAVVAWMVREYRQSVDDGVGQHNSRNGVSGTTQRDVVPLAVAVAARPRTTAAPCGEITYSALARRPRQTSRPAGTRASRAISGRASALR